MKTTEYMCYHPYNSNLKVEWVDLGEGLDGDYNPNDPDDMELLRFDVSYRETRNDEWEAVPDSSYCTMVQNTTPPKVLKELLRIIYNTVCPCWLRPPRVSVKRICEGFSWLNGEVETINRTPDEDLPLLVESIKTHAGKQELEKRLKFE